MSTRRERRERKVEKRGEWAGKARERSDAAFGAAGKMAEAIPFGQPILVGHHSEKRDRRYRGRMHAKMDKEVRSKFAGLATFETPKKIGLLEHDFSVDSGELTPTLKVKRRVVDRNYKSVIDGLYAD